MDALTAKILAMVLLGGISMALGILPVFLRRFCNFGGTTTGPRGQFFLSALSCFGGGVILTTCFTHMLPEVNFFLENNIKNGHFPETGKKRSLINSTKISQNTTNSVLFSGETRCFSLVLPSKLWSKASLKSLLLD